MLLVPPTAVRCSERDTSVFRYLFVFVISLALSSSVDFFFYTRIPWYDTYFFRHVLSYEGSLVSYQVPGTSIACFDYSEVLDESSLGVGYG